MTARRLAILSGLVIAYIVFMYLVASARYTADVATKTDRTRLHLERVARQTQHLQHFERTAPAVLRTVLGRRWANDAWRADCRALLTDIPTDHWEVHCFDGQGRYLGREPQLPTTRPFLIAGMDDRTYSRRRDHLVEFLECWLRTVRKPWWEPAFITNKHFGHWWAWMFENLKAMPRTVAVGDVAGRPSVFGMWDSGRTVHPGQIGAALILAEVGTLSSTSLAQRRIEALRAAGCDFGIIPLIARNDGAPSPLRAVGPTLLPARVSPRRARAIAEQYFLCPTTTVHHDNERFVVVPLDEEHLLCARVPQGHPHASPWLLALAALWIPWAFRQVVRPTTAAWPLAGALTMLAVGAAGVPVLLAAFYWQQFLATHEQAMTRQALTHLERYLINIDAHFPTLLRRLDARYKEWQRRFEAAIAAPLPPPARPRPAGRRHPFRYDFPPGTPLAALVDETRPWEFGGEVDSISVVSSTGVMLRDFAQDDFGIRRFAFMPATARVEALKGFYEQSDEKESACRRIFRLHMPLPRTIDWETWIALSDPKDRESDDSLCEAHTSAMRLINEHTGAVPQRPRLDDTVFSAVIEALPRSDGWDFARQVAASLGEFIVLNKDGLQVAFWATAMRSPRGVAEYLAVFFHHSMTLEQTYFRELFAAGTPRIPGLELRAVSLLHRAQHWPAPRLERLRRAVEPTVTPPRILVSRVGQRQGRRVLCAALKCQRATGYILVGRMPYDIVTTSIQHLQYRLCWLAVAVVLVLATIGWRLFSGTVFPIRRLLAGLRALETHEFKHRIQIGTRDEWDRLAEVFNEAIRGMEELAVAQAVQTRLLPGGPIVHAAGTYHGTSIMSLAVGGDYHDAVATPDGRLAFIIGDATGHGVPAALMVAMVKAAFGALIADGIASPGMVLTRMNALLLPSQKTAMAMTALVGFVDTTGVVTLASAGHAWPFLRQPDGTVNAWSGTPGFPLCVWKKATYADAIHRLDPGYELFAYTDGLVEACDPANEAFGETRLATTLARIPVNDEQSPLAPVLDALADFTQRRTWTDDVTVAVIRRPHAHPGPGQSDTCARSALHRPEQSDGRRH